MVWKICLFLFLAISYSDGRVPSGPLFESMKEHISKLQREFVSITSDNIVFSSFAYTLAYLRVPIFLGRELRPGFTTVCVIHFVIFSYFTDFGDSCKVAGKFLPLPSQENLKYPRCFIRPHNLVLVISLTCTAGTNLCVLFFIMNRSGIGID